MDALLIVLVVGGPLLVIGALVWSSSLRGPQLPRASRGDPDHVPGEIPDEYAYERRMQEKRDSGEFERPQA